MHLALVVALSPAFAQDAPARTLTLAAPGSAIFASAALNPFRGRKVLPVMLKSNAADLAELDALFERGALRVVIDSRFPIAELPKAWERSRSGRAAGKIVIEV